MKRLLPLIFLFPFVVFAHEYGTSIPERIPMGFRVAATGSWGVRWSPYSPDYSAADAYYPTTDFYSPSALTAWMAATGADTGSWIALQTLNNAPNANVVAHGRRCADGYSWVAGSGNSGSGSCIIFDDTACDAEHVLDIRTPSPGVEEAWCVDPPERECPGALMWDHLTGACGEVICTSPQILNPDGDACIDPPECPPPNTYDTFAHQCVHPDCPPGQIIAPVEVSPGQPPVNLCTDPEEVPDDQGCDFLDPAVEYAENVGICASEKAACANVNGTIIVLPDGTKRCYPLEPAEEPEDPEEEPPPREPKCPSSDFVSWDLDIGDYVCRPKSPDPKDIPGSEKPPEKDTDNDGTPDRSDSDMDGDGTSNSTDTDIDGDGIGNDDDPSPWGGSGPGEGEEGEGDSVTGGGNCIDKPQCTGSPVECAIVYQTWKTRCEIEKQNTHGDLDGFDREADRDYFGVTELDDDIDELKTDFTEKVEEFRGLVSSDLSIGGSGSLPCLGTVTYGGESTEWCLDEYSDALSNIGPAILFLSYFIAAIIVLRR